MRKKKRIERCVYFYLCFVFLHHHHRFSFEYLNTNSLHRHLLCLSSYPGDVLFDYSCISLRVPTHFAKTCLIILLFLFAIVFVSCLFIEEQQNSLVKKENRLDINILCSLIIPFGAKSAPMQIIDKKFFVHAYFLFLVVVVRRSSFSSIKYV
jgi:hypothetical protein